MDSITTSKAIDESSLPTPAPPPLLRDRNSTPHFSLQFSHPQLMSTRWQSVCPCLLVCVCSMKRHKYTMMREKESAQQPIRTSRLKKRTLKCCDFALHSTNLHSFLKNDAAYCYASVETAFYSRAATSYFMAEEKIMVFNHFYAKLSQTKD